MPAWAIYHSIISLFAILSMAGNLHFASNSWFEGHGDGDEFIGGTWGWIFNTASVKRYFEYLYVLFYQRNYGTSVFWLVDSISLNTEVPLTSSLLSYTVVYCLWTGLEEGGLCGEAIGSLQICTTGAIDYSRLCFPVGLCYLSHIHLSAELLSMHDCIRSRSASRS